MSHVLDLSDDLKIRVAALAARSTLTPAQIIADALENGHSLEWQERFLEKVSAGLSDADQDRFGSEEDVDKVINKYRPA